MKSKSIIQHILEILGILVFVVLVRSLVFEPYLVPSGSMLPNLLEGDRIIVNKYVYGISRHSFPFSPPLFKGRLFEFEQPQRGDIVVFELDKIYVKRLVGEPGDTVQVIDGILYINGQEKKQVRLKESFRSGGVNYTQYKEQLTKDKSITVLDVTDGSEFDNTKLHTVPRGHYFFMGDNRDFSRDSRDIYFMGFVPKEKILGRVNRILFSSSTLEIYNIFGVIKNFRLDRTWKKLN